MFKKLPILAFALAALAPAAPAAAWERVCLKLPLWKTWFAADFGVVSDFPTDGELPGSYQLRPNIYLHLPLGVGNRNIRAGHHEVNDIAVNQTRCIDITYIPRGQPFFVYVAPLAGDARVCETHHTNPNQWYPQTDRPYRTLNYEAWGGTYHAKCKFVFES